MDFTYGADDNAPSFVEAGIYPATIKKAKEGPSKKGNMMLTLLLRLDNGLEIWDHVVDSTAEMCRTKSDKFLTALGIEAKKGAKVSVDVTELEGQRVDVDIVLTDGKNEVFGYVASSSEAPVDGKGPF